MIYGVSSRNNRAEIVVSKYSRLFFFFFRGLDQRALLSILLSFVRRSVLCFIPLYLPYINFPLLHMCSVCVFFTSPTNPSPVLLALLSALPCQALELISNEVGPDDPPPSQGNKNPAVMKYDPTGLRTTMSATNKAWEESLQVCECWRLCFRCVLRAARKSVICTSF